LTRVKLGSGSGGGERLGVPDLHLIISRKRHDRLIALNSGFPTPSQQVLKKCKRTPTGRSDDLPAIGIDDCQRSMLGYSPCQGLELAAL
jgi:hypothetical protein